MYTNGQPGLTQEGSWNNSAVNPPQTLDPNDAGFTLIRAISISNSSSNGTVYAYRQGAQSGGAPIAVCPPQSGITQLCSVATPIVFVFSGGTNGSWTIHVDSEPQSSSGFSTNVIIGGNGQIASNGYTTLANGAIELWGQYNNIPADGSAEPNGTAILFNLQGLPNNQFPSNAFVVNVEVLDTAAADSVYSTKVVFGSLQVSGFHVIVYGGQPNEECSLYVTAIGN